MHPIQPIQKKDQWMLQQTMRFLMRNALQSSIANVLIIIVYAWSNSDIILENPYALTWVVLGAILGIVRITSYVLYQKKRSLQSTQRWLNTYRLFILFSGLIYGSILYIFFDTVSTVMQVLTMFIVVGMPAAAVGTHAVDRATFRLFLYSTVLPSGLYLFVFANTEYNMVAVLMVIFLVVLDRSGGTTSRSLQENIELTYYMSYRATHDPLVGLFNREELENQFERRAPISKRGIALMFIDLDNFKPLNDTLGHHAGDQALIDVADIIKTSVRSDDIAARLGGDEFVVILLLDELKEASAIARSILAKVSQMTFDESYVGLSSSIGICFNESTNVSFSRLLRTADMACYKSKEAGKNQLTVLPYGVSIMH